MLRLRQEVAFNTVGLDPTCRIYISYVSQDKMISAHTRVFIGKGKKVLAFDPETDEKQDILKAAMGRSGNLRAPTLKKGGQLFIGYNEDIYTRLD